MTGKGRFGSFLPAKSTGEPEKTSPQEVQQAPSKQVPSMETLSIPPAPVREERKAFSTRVKPSQKAMLDAYVMDLKRAGWPVSQEGVLEELLNMLSDDMQVRNTITARLTKRPE